MLDAALGIERIIRACRNESIARLDLQLQRRLQDSNTLLVSGEHFYCHRMLLLYPQDMFS